MNREPWLAGRWLGVGDVDRSSQEDSGREATGSGGAEVKWGPPEAPTRNLDLGGS